VVCQLVGGGSAGPGGESPTGGLIPRLPAPDVRVKKRGRLPKEPACLVWCLSYSKLGGELYWDTNTFIFVRKNSNIEPLFRLPLHAQDQEGILSRSPVPDLEMEMGPRGKAGIPYPPDDRSGAHLLS
jgi:hypothetical protein